MQQEGIAAKPFPLFYLALSLMAGLLLCPTLQEWLNTYSNFRIEEVVIALAILILSVWVGSFGLPTFHRSRLQTLILRPSFFVLGLFLGILSNQTEEVNSVVLVANPQKDYQVVVCKGPAIEQNQFWKLDAYLPDAGFTNSKQQKSVRLRWPKDSLGELNTHFLPQDTIVIPSELIQNKLYFGKVQRQAYLQNEPFLLSTYQLQHPIRLLERFSGKLFYQLQAKANKLPPEEREGHALLAALLLGKRDLIDKEDISHLAITGTLHLIAISGLHIMLVFSLLTGSISLFGVSNPKQKKLIYASTGLILWSFVLFTGGAASAIRAAILGSTLLLSLWRGIRGSGLNTLGGAALIQLIIWPDSIWQVGFQLSYSAVLGIMLFQQAVNYNPFQHPKVVSYFIGLGLTSLGAQLGTMAISLMTFNQFPTFFLPANLIAIPFGTVELWLGMVWFCVQIFGLDFLLGDSVIFVMKILAQTFFGFCDYLAAFSGYIKGPYTLNNIEFWALGSFVFIALYHFGFQESQAVKRNSFRASAYLLWLIPMLSISSVWWKYTSPTYFLKAYSKGYVIEKNWQEKGIHFSQILLADGKVYENSNKAIQVLAHPLPHHKLPHGLSITSLLNQTIVVVDSSAFQVQAWPMLKSEPKDSAQAKHLQPIVLLQALPGRTEKAWLSFQSSFQPKVVYLLPSARRKLSTGFYPPFRKFLAWAEKSRLEVKWVEYNQAIEFKAL